MHELYKLDIPRPSSDSVPVRHNLFDSFEWHIVAALLEHLLLRNLTQRLAFVDDAGTKFNRDSQSCRIFLHINRFRCGVRWIGRNYWMINSWSRIQMEMSCGLMWFEATQTQDSPGRNCFTNTKVLRVLFSIMIETLSCTFNISQLFSLPFWT